MTHIAKHVVRLILIALMPPLVAGCGSIGKPIGTAVSLAALPVRGAYTVGDATVRTTAAVTKTTATVAVKTTGKVAGTTIDVAHCAVETGIKHAAPVGGAVAKKAVTSRIAGHDAVEWVTAPEVAVPATAASKAVKMGAEAQRKAAEIEAAKSAVPNPPTDTD